MFKESSSLIMPEKQKAKQSTNTLRFKRNDKFNFRKWVSKAMETLMK